MQDNQSVAFHTTLTQRDWDEELSGWRCPALKIPGAQLECIFVSGTRIDRSWYEVSYELEVIRWVRAERPEQCTVLVKLTKELSTKELTLKWKKLAIILPFAAAILVSLIAGAVSFFGRSNERTTDEAQKDQIASCVSKVKITAPVALQRVGRGTIVEGWFENVPPGQEIWVLIHPAGIGGFYPQNPADKRTSNTWLAPVTIGLKDDLETEFFIYAVLADKDGQEALRAYMNQARTQNDSPGIPELPKGLQVCHYIKVTRK